MCFCFFLLFIIGAPPDWISLKKKYKIEALPRSFDMNGKSLFSERFAKLTGRNHTDYKYWSRWPFSVGIEITGLLILIDQWDRRDIWWARHCPNSWKCGIKVRRGCFCAEDAARYQCWTLQDWCGKQTLPVHYKQKAHTWWTQALTVFIHPSSVNTLLKSVSQ